MGALLRLEISGTWRLPRRPQLRHLLTWVVSRMPSADLVSRRLLLHHLKSQRKSPLHLLI